MRIETGKEEIIKYSYVCDLCGKGAEQVVVEIYVPVVRNLILEIWDGTEISRSN